MDSRSEGGGRGNEGTAVMHRASGVKSGHDERARCDEDKKRCPLSAFKDVNNDVC